MKIDIVKGAKDSAATFGVTPERETEIIKLIQELSKPDNPDAVLEGINDLDLPPLEFAYAYLMVGVTLCLEELT